MAFPYQLHQKAEIEERYTRVAALYLARKSLRAIGEEIGASHELVRRDLKVIHKRWQESAKEDIAKRAAIELARIDNLEAAAWAAWERSCLDKERHRSKKTKGRTTRETTSQTAGEGKDKRTSKTTKIIPLPDLDALEVSREGQAGDPRFLAEIRACIRMRCELMGLLETEKGGIQTVVTVVNAIDIDVVTGRKPGVPVEELRRVTPN